MKTVTLQIPDNKLDFFLKLVEELGLSVTEKNEQNIKIPNWHKEEVEKRIQNTPKSEYKDWDSLHNEIQL